MSNVRKVDQEMKALSRSALVRAVAKKTGKSVGTIWRYARNGCDINDPASIKAFVDGNELRQHANLIRRKKGGNQTKTDSNHAPDLDQIALMPVGKKGAAAALARLEIFEVQAHGRLLQAIENGDALRIKTAQENYLRTAEVLRRLDAAIETERRNSEEQVPKKAAEAIVLHIAEWLRIAFAQFLSSESRSLMGIKDISEFQAYALNRFQGIIFAAVKTSRKTNSPIPTWAETMVIEAWNTPRSLILAAMTEGGDP
jgi:hypothetical protein